MSSVSSEIISKVIENNDVIASCWRTYSELPQKSWDAWVIANVSSVTTYVGVSAFDAVLSFTAVGNGLKIGIKIITKVCGVANAIVEKRADRGTFGNAVDIGLLSGEVIAQGLTCVGDCFKVVASDSVLASATSFLAQVVQRVWGYISQNYGSPKIDLINTLPHLELELQIEAADLHAKLVMIEHNQLTSIPRRFWSEPRLLRKCAISGGAIRKLVVPAVNLPPSATPCYELQVVELWLRTRPHIAPPGWPVNLLPLPLRVAHFKPSSFWQHDINVVLGEISKELNCMIEKEHEEERLAAKLNAVEELRFAAQALSTPVPPPRSRRLSLQLHQIGPFPVTHDPSDSGKAALRINSIIIEYIGSNEIPISQRESVSFLLSQRYFNDPRLPASVSDLVVDYAEIKESEASESNSGVLVGVPVGLSDTLSNPQPNQPIASDSEEENTTSSEPEGVNCAVCTIQ